MFDPPLTLDEARTRIYNRWGGNPKGLPYNPKYCAYDVFDAHLFFQCSRKPGNGPSGLYCKQHAKMVVK